MAPAKPRKRTSKSGLWLMLLLVLVGGVLAFGSLVALGQIENPFKPKVVDAKDAHPGQVAVPVCTKLVPVFTEVKQSDLLDPKTAQPKVSWIDESAAKKEGFFTKFPEITGRVMKFDKQPGYAFTESDFYPRGSVASPSLGIEPGKTGWYVDNPAKIEGLAPLKRHDKFRLYAVLPDSSQGQAPNGPTTFSSEDVRKAAVTKEAWQSQQQLIVNDGIVIVALSAARGGQMYIQITPDERNALDRAISKGARITCSTLSTIPGTQLSQTPAPDSKKPEETSTIEVLSEKGSRGYVVPKSSGEVGEEDAQTVPPKESTGSVPPPKDQPKKGNALKQR